MKLSRADHGGGTPRDTPPGAVLHLALPVAPWCNGSTTDSGSVSLGSNPGGATTHCLGQSEQNAAF